MLSHLKKFPIWLIRRCLLTGIFATTITATPVHSAEHIQFFYGPFEPTLAVDDLQHLAETGEVTGSLSVLSRRMSDEQIAELQRFLSLEFDINAVMMSQITYSSVGEQLLQRTGEIIQTDSFLNGFYALRAALYFAAEDGRLSVMDVIDHFPQKTIQVNFSLAMSVLEENRQMFSQRDTMIAALRDQAANRSPTGEFSDSPHQLGPYRWQTETIAFQNPGRQDASQFHLFLPAIAPKAPQTVPVIVISHGMASSAWSLASLAEHLASHGYAVLLLEHPETTAQRFSQFFSGLAGPPDAVTLLHRPRDVTAALDTLAHRSHRHPDLQMLTLASVGVLGHSLGGYTALAVAGAEVNNVAQLATSCQNDTIEQQPILNLSMLIQCRFTEIPPDASLEVQDERIKAAIALNPLTSQIFGEAGLGAIDVPVMLVGSLDDYFVPALPEQVEPYGWLQSRDRYLVLIEDGTHFSLLTDKPATELPPIPGFITGPALETTHQQMAALSLTFFDRHLLLQKEAENYLNQSYLDQLFGETDSFEILSGEFSWELEEQ